MTAAFNRGFGVTPDDLPPGDSTPFVGEQFSVPVQGYGPCNKCFHGFRSHAPSGPCQVPDCRCESFDGPRLAGRSPEIHAAELEDSIDYEYGVRALKQAGYCAICQVYTYGRPHHHGPRMSADAEADHVRGTRESISVYAARMADERDAARAELARIKAEFEAFARDALRKTGGESS